MTNHSLPPAPRTVEQVIEYLESALDQMRQETDKHQLTGLDPDTAYELGYETAIFDLRHAGDVPEVGLIQYQFQPSPAEEEDVD